MDEKGFISLHEDGGRTIMVGEKDDGQRIYKVSPTAMAMASPIWKAMFNPVSGFRESNPDTVVEFPGDDPDVMLILLRIAHLQFSEVPKSITFACLAELAVLCDKYDTVSLVQPFIENWMSPWTLLCLESGYEDWLFIAWTFGCQQIFDRLAESLVLSTSAGDLDLLFCDEMPPEIIESILEVRGKTIEKLLNLFHETMENLLANRLCSNSFAHGPKTCNHIMLGFLFKALYPLGLGPQKVASTEVKISISKITEELNKFNFSWAFGGAVSVCNLGLKVRPKVAEILRDIPSAVKEHHTRHMEEQSKKSGIGDLRVPESKLECVLM